MNRQLVYVGTRAIEVVDAEPAEVPAGHVRVGVEACGICGSDVFAYAGQVSIRAPGTRMGHEIAGRVLEVAPDVDAVAPGDAVAVNPVVTCGSCTWCGKGLDNLCRSRRLYGCTPELHGGYADEIVVREANVVPVGDDVPLEHAALVEPLAVGSHAAGVASRLGEPDRALVLGGGPIGLATALALQRIAPRQLLLSEPQPARRAVAARLGIDAVAPDQLGEAGTWDVAVDAVGITPTLTAALTAVRPQGLVVFVGLGQDVVGMPGHPVETGERRIAGSSVYTAAEFTHTTEWVSSGERDLSPLIESRIGFGELVDAFDGYADRTRDAFKTILRPSL